MSGKAKAKPEPMKFDEALRKLEEIADRLEEGNLPLEECVEVFERGMELSGHLEKLLKDAERRIELLTRKEDGSVETTPYTDSPEEGPEE